MSLTHDFFLGAATARGWNTKTQHNILLEYIYGGPDYQHYHDFTVEIAKQHGVPREEIVGDVASHMGWSDQIQVDIMLDFVESWDNGDAFEEAIFDLIDAENAAAHDLNFGTPITTTPAPASAPTPASAPATAPAPAFRPVLSRPRRPKAAERRIEVWL